MKSSFEALRGASGRGRMGTGKRFSGFVLRYGCFASLPSPRAGRTPSLHLFEGDGGVAFDRGIKAVEGFGLVGPVDRWHRIRAEIHEEVCRRAFNTDVKTDQLEAQAFPAFVPHVGGVDLAPLDTSPSRARPGCATSTSYAGASAAVRAPSPTGGVNFGRRSGVKIGRRLTPRSPSAATEPILRSISLISKPVAERAKSRSRVLSSSSLTPSRASSQEASSPSRLSAIMNARRSASPRWSSVIVGTSSSPRRLAASTRPWPARAPPFSSTRTGTLNPNAAMLSAMRATCRSE